MIVMRREAIDLDTFETYIDIDLGQVSTVKSTGDICLHDRDGRYGLLFTGTEVNRIFNQARTQRIAWERWYGSHRKSRKKK